MLISRASGSASAAAANQSGAASMGAGVPSGVYLTFALGGVGLLMGVGRIFA